MSNLLQQIPLKWQNVRILTRASNLATLSLFLLFVLMLPAIEKTLSTIAFEKGRFRRLRIYLHKFGKKSVLKIAVQNCVAVILKGSLSSSFFQSNRSNFLYSSSALSFFAMLRGKSLNFGFSADFKTNWGATNPIFLIESNELVHLIFNCLSNETRKFLHLNGSIIKNAYFKEKNRVIHKKLITFQCNRHLPG